MPLKVGLYIPCYNAAKTLAQCLNGVLGQTYPIKKIVVVDDGSTDNTVAIASKYDVTVVKHGRNRGLAAARNTALRHIRADYIASVDADCVLSSSWLSCLVRSMHSPRIAGVGGKLIEKFAGSIADAWRSIHMKQYWEDSAHCPPFLYGSNTLYRRDALRQVGFYSEKLRNNYEDVDMSKRLRGKRWRLQYDTEAVCYHLRRDSLYSILNTYWQWHIPYYRNKHWYSSNERFVAKIKDNIGLANRYIEEDLAAGRVKLIYVDFLLALHHSIRDFEYFVSQGTCGADTHSPLLIWLSLLDLTFFYHFDADKQDMGTFMLKEAKFIQNFFVVNLLLNSCLRVRFTNSRFRQLVHTHLLASVYGIKDPKLVEKVLTLTSLHEGWKGILTKGHRYLSTPFLESLSLGLGNWMGILIARFPGIVNSIEEAAIKTNIYRRA